MSSQKRGAPMFIEEKNGWKFTLFSSWMIQMIHLQHLRGTSKSGVFVSTIFTVSLWGDRRLKGLPTDVIIPTKLNFWGQRISNRSEACNFDDLASQKCAVTLHICSTPFSCYYSIWIYHNKLKRPHSKQGSWEGKIKQNKIKRPFRMLALWM